MNNPSSPAPSPSHHVRLPSLWAERASTELQNPWVVSLHSILLSRSKSPCLVGKAVFYLTEKVFLKCPEQLTIMKEFNKDVKGYFERHQNIQVIHLQVASDWPLCRVRLADLRLLRNLHIEVERQRALRSPVGKNRPKLSVCVHMCAYTYRSIRSVNVQS